MRTRLRLDYLFALVIALFSAQASAVSVNVTSPAQGIVFDPQRGVIINFASDGTVVTGTGPDYVAAERPFTLKAETPTGTATVNGAAKLRTSRAAVAALGKLAARLMLPLTIGDALWEAYKAFNMTCTAGTTDCQISTSNNTPYYWIGQISGASDFYQSGSEACASMAPYVMVGGIAPGQLSGTTQNADGSYTCQYSNVYGTASRTAARGSCQTNYVLDKLTRICVPKSSTMSAATQAQKDAAIDDAATNRDIEAARILQYALDHGQRMDFTNSTYDPNMPGHTADTGVVIETLSTDAQGNVVVTKSKHTLSVQSPINTTGQPVSMMTPMPVKVDKTTTTETNGTPTNTTTSKVTEATPGTAPAVPITTTATTGGQIPPNQTDCDKYPNSVGCADWSNPAEDPIQNRDITAGAIVPVAFGGAGYCPAGRTITLMGKAVTFPMTQICDFASSVKPIVISLGWISALMIVFGFKGSANGS